MVLHFLFSTSNGEVHYNWDELARDKAVQSGACDVCTMIVWTRFRLIQLLGESAAANCERSALVTFWNSPLPETRGVEENILIGATQRVAFISTF